MDPPCFEDVFPNFHIEKWEDLPAYLCRFSFACAAATATAAAFVTAAAFSNASTAATTAGHRNAKVPQQKWGVEKFDNLKANFQGDLEGFLLNTCHSSWCFFWLIHIMINVDFFLFRGNGVVENYPPENILLFKY